MEWNLPDSTFVMEQTMESDGIFWQRNERSGWLDTTLSADCQPVSSDYKTAAAYFTARLAAHSLSFEHFKAINKVLVPFATVKSI